MLKKVFIQGITLFSAVMLWNCNFKNVQADELDASSNVTKETDITDTGFGGMSQILDKYYDEIFSETGISINNVSTTIMVDGEKLEANDDEMYLFQKFGVASISNYVNVRAEASVDSEVVGRLYHAGVVNVEGTVGEWTKITSDQVSGYVCSDYLVTGDKVLSMIEKSYTKYAQVTCDTINIRSGPGEDYKAVSTASLGAQMEVVEVLDEWVQVTVSGVKGKTYVSKNYVDFVYNFKYAKTLDEVKTDVNCMVWPLPSDHTIYSYYGYRVAPTKGASRFHKGLDIGGAKGSSIVSVLSGTVSKVSYSSSAGNYVEVSHGNGVVTRYLHCSKILVKTGQYVDQGEKIALVGSTGTSTGPHLHFSLVMNGKSVDPYPYLKRVH